MDLTGSMPYFGSPSGKVWIAADLGEHVNDYTARKTIPLRAARRATSGDVISMTKSIRHCASPWSPMPACWTTTYLGDTIEALRGEGFEISRELAGHLTPAQHDHINFYGTYSFDIDAEQRREGHRPLRIPA